MKNLFRDETLAEIKQRLGKLQPNSARLWGKMDAAQMLSHCSALFDIAVGNTFPPREFLGRIFGKLVKPQLTNEKPFKKNLPTSKAILILTRGSVRKKKHG